MPTHFACAQADASDIAAAVRYCREKGLQLAVKGGGHSWVSMHLLLGFVELLRGE